jgi:hypothetical protein
MACLYGQPFFVHLCVRLPAAHIAFLSSLLLSEETALEKMNSRKYSRIRNSV